MATRLVPLLFALVLTAPAFAALPLPDLPSADPIVAPQVTIVRDAYGVPHIYADDVYALFWGNGYAMAEDRLFQMDVLRHVGRGESARYLGPSQLEMDLAARRELYTEEERRESLAALPEGDRLMFQAFADGVNAFIAKTRADPTLLSAEFYAIGHPPERWIPEDTIAIAQYLLDIFGAGSGGNELENAKLYHHLVTTLGVEGARDAFDDLFWMHEPAAYSTIPANEYVYPATEGPLPWNQIPPRQWEIIEAAAGAQPFAGAKTLAQAAEDAGFPTKFGSNALVVSPRLSASGNAMLLGGPQMGYFNPMVPYEVALHGAGFDAVGMGVGGAPGVIIGRTEHYAWTVTSGSSDQVDVVAVKLVEGNPRAYFVSGTSGPTKAMECRIETHVGPPTAVDPNPPVLAVQEVCRTERGPVFAMNEDAGYAFVRERTHRLDELRSGILWLTLGRAQDLQQFQDHMETFCFEFNFHVAADNGDIAYFHWGCNPVRAEGYDPRFPRLAGEWDWTDIRSGRELPHIVNPQKGYLANWNNKPAQGWSSGDAIEKWGAINRVQLIEDAVGDKRGDGSYKLTYEDLLDINERISTRSPFPPHLTPFLLDAGRASGTPQGIAAADALVAWADAGYGWDDADGDGLYDHPGFAIYETWRGLVQERVFRDEMGDHTREMGFVPESSSDPHAADHGREDHKDNVLSYALMGTSRHAWCDDAATPAMESCQQVLQETFAEALANLTARYGPDVEEWNQPVHTIKFVALSGGPAHRIPMVNRPSFNHVYDWGTGQAGSVLPPGTNQYWKPADFLRFNLDRTYPDAHKTDQLDLYVAFGFKPAQMAPQGVASTRTFAAQPPLL